MSRTSPAEIPAKIDMDDGSFPLAHTALLTLAKTKVSGAQRAIIDVIFTQTYGYHYENSPHQERIKKRHTRAQIAYEYFMQATWMGKQEVSRAVNALVKWKIIGRDKNTTPYTYWFNPKVEEWDPKCWRVSRIANSKQDSEQSTNQRTVSSKQDSEQLAGQLTKSSQDSEQCVSRIANSSQVSALEPQGLEPPLKESIKEIYKENKESTKGNSTLVATEQNKGSPDKKLSPKEFLNLENYHKVKYLEKLPKNEQVGLCVIAYNHEFPKQAEKFGTGGTITARKVFEEAIKKHHVPPYKLLVEILYDQSEEGEPTPWELVDCLKGQRGLESTWAYVCYDMERYDREVGIKTYGPVDTQGPSP